MAPKISKLSAAAKAKISKSAAAKATAAGLRRMEKPEKHQIELAPNPLGPVYLSRAVRLTKSLKVGTVTVGNRFGPLAIHEPDSGDEEAEAEAAVAGGGVFKPEGVDDDQQAEAAGDGVYDPEGVGDDYDPAPAEGDGHDYYAEAAAGDDAAAAGEEVDGPAAVGGGEMA